MSFTRVTTAPAVPPPRTRLMVRALVAFAAFAALAAALLGPSRASAQTPTATATATPAATIELAPIDNVEIVTLESQPVQYRAVVTSGLPGGCAAFESIESRRTGTRIDITVRNAMSVPPNGACTAIYGIVEKTVDLGADFAAGTTYTVVVNAAGTQGKTATFTTAAAAPVVTPTPAPDAPRPAATGGLGVPGSRGTGLAGITAIAAAALLLTVILVRVRQRRR